jgi:hypothetical protein
MKKKAVKKQAKKKAKNTNYSIEYRCGECGYLHLNKEDVENCCEPCQHIDTNVYVECGDIGIYCNDCDKTLFEGDVEETKFKEYILKNHKKCSFITARKGR